MGVLDVSTYNWFSHFGCNGVVRGIFHFTVEAICLPLAFFVAALSRRLCDEKDGDKDRRRLSFYRRDFSSSAR